VLQVYYPKIKITHKAAKEGKKAKMKMNK